MLGRIIGYKYGKDMCKHKHVKIYSYIIQVILTDKSEKGRSEFITTKNYKDKISCKYLELTKFLEARKGLMVEGKVINKVNNNECPTKRFQIDNSVLRIGYVPSCILHLGNVSLLPGYQIRDERILSKGKVIKPKYRVD